MPNFSINVVELIEILLLVVTQHELLFRSRKSWIFVRHIDFRFNHSSYILVLSAIESGVLENINVNAFFLQFTLLST